MALTLAGTPAINGLALPSDTFVSGMVLVNKTDFTAASSVSINNCFTSTYANYKVIVESIGTGTSPAGLLMRFRSGGTDNSVANYITGSILVTNAGGPTRGYSVTTYQNIGGVADYYGVSAVDICAPQLARSTTILAPYSSCGSANNEFGIANGLFYAATQFDGLTIYPGSGTFTGTVRVYGMRNT